MFYASEIIVSCGIEFCNFRESKRYLSIESWVELQRKGLSDCRQILNSFNNGSLRSGRWSTRRSKHKEIASLNNCININWIQSRLKLVTLPIVLHSLSSKSSTPFLNTKAHTTCNALIKFHLPANFLHINGRKFPVTKPC